MNVDKINRNLAHQQRAYHMARKSVIGANWSHYPQLAYRAERLIDAAVYPAWRWALHSPGRTMR